MNNKSFLLSTLAGTIAYFLLGWLFYGILFKDLYPAEQDQGSLFFIFLGCLLYTLIFSFLYHRWGTIRTFGGGAKAALVLGFLYSTSMNFFMASSKGFHVEHFVTDVLVATLSTVLMGGIVGFVMGKTK